MSEPIDLEALRWRCSEPVVPPCPVCGGERVAYPTEDEDGGIIPGGSVYWWCEISDHEPHITRPEPDPAVLAPLPATEVEG